jgi:hypothetical protein
MTQAADRIRQELHPGETLLWSGRSRRGFGVHPASIVLLLAVFLVIGLIAGLAALNNMQHTIRIIEIVTEAARQRFTVTGIISGISILLGVIAIWGFVFYPLQRMKTLYGLTEGRAVIIPGLSLGKPKSFALNTLNFLALARKGGTKGTIVFGEYPADYSKLDSSGIKGVVGSWKWFGYDFDLFEFGEAAGGKSTRRKPVFGRFEYIENADDLYDLMRQRIAIRQIEAPEEPPVQTGITPFVGDLVRNPGVVVFLIDVSGSMDGKKLDLAKRGLLGALSMAQDNQVGLLAFDREIVTLEPVAPLTRNRGPLSQAVRELRAGSNTALFDALREGIRMADEADSSIHGVRAVVLLTDGQANSGNSGFSDIISMSNPLGQAIFRPKGGGEKYVDSSGKPCDVKDVRGTELAIATAHPVSVYFIGIGEDADMEVGRLLAEATGAESGKGIELPGGQTLARVQRVRTVDIGRVLEEFRYF